MTRYYLGGEMVVDEGLKILEEEKKTKPAPPMSPWFYDTAEGKFEKYAITQGQPPVGGFPYFQYVPTLKQFFLGGANGIGFFDPAAKAWSDVDDKGTRPPGYDHGGCYDEKRDRIYMGNGMNDPTSPLFIYDVKLSTWTNPTPIGTPPGAFRTNDASVTYDVANDVVIVFHYKYKKIYTYVPDTNTWTHQPFPAAVLTSVSGSFSTFYDPELNAYFCYGASDSADNGIMWAYRYKK
jgi:hypothetical protein